MHPVWKDEDLPIALFVAAAYIYATRNATSYSVSPNDAVIAARNLLASSIAHAEEMSQAMEGQDGE